MEATTPLTAKGEMKIAWTTFPGSSRIWPGFFQALPIRPDPLPLCRPVPPARIEHQLRGR